MEDRTIVGSDIRKSSIELNDGAIISIAPTIQNVKKVSGQIGPQGEPVYNMMISWQFKTTPPPVKNKRRVKRP